MLLDRLRDYLQPLSEEGREDFPEGQDPAPCLVAVRWPEVHEDRQFEDDVIFFALDELWANKAPEGATTYTVAELKAMAGLSTAVIRLLHAAKRTGRIVLESSQPVHRSVLDAMKDVGATPIDV
jgi:hypothetical protein